MRIALIKIFRKDYFFPCSNFNSRVTNNFVRQYGAQFMRGLNGSGCSNRSTIQQERRRETISLAMVK